MHQQQQQQKIEIKTIFEIFEMKYFKFISKRVVDIASNSLDYPLHTAENLKNLSDCWLF